MFGFNISLGSAVDVVCHTPIRVLRRYLAGPPVPPIRAMRDKEIPYLPVEPNQYQRMAAPPILQRVPGFSETKSYVAGRYSVDTRRYEGPDRC